LLVYSNWARRACDFADASALRRDSSSGRASRVHLPPQGGKGAAPSSVDRAQRRRPHRPGAVKPLARLLRFAASRDRAAPMRRFVSMIFGETSRPLAGLVRQRSWKPKA
jgi:hypothetical protein